jgi:hypothetical protein
MFCIVYRSSKGRELHFIFDDNKYHTNVCEVITENTPGYIKQDFMIGSYLSRGKFKRFPNEVSKLIKSISTNAVAGGQSPPCIKYDVITYLPLTQQDRSQSKTQS